MLIRLQKKATTTPAIGEYIRTCGKPKSLRYRRQKMKVDGR